MMQYTPQGLNQMSMPFDWRYIQEKSDLETKVPEGV